jgi:hypothetical protein
MAFQSADRFQKTKGKSVLSEIRQCRQWSRPQEGELKLNSDGAFDSVRKDGGWGFVIKDGRGRVLKSGAGREDFLQDALHAASLGCLAGLHGAANMGIFFAMLDYFILILGLNGKLKF